MSSFFDLIFVIGYFSRRRRNDYNQNSDQFARPRIPHRETSRPSPAAAAKGKVARCYSGPLSSRTVASMIKCDSHGPLVIHVAKLYAEPDGQSFSAFGRIYSGTVKPGEHSEDVCFYLVLAR